MAGNQIREDIININSKEVEDDVDKDNINEKNPQSDKNRLPLSRIKSIIKMDPDVKKTSQDAVFVISKATELFIQHLASDTAVKTLSEKKKTITRQHLDHVFFNKDCYSFLEGLDQGQVENNFESGINRCPGKL